MTTANFVALDADSTSDSKPIGRMVFHTLPDSLGLNPTAWHDALDAAGFNVEKSDVTPTSPTQALRWGVGTGRWSYHLPITDEDRELVTVRAEGTDSYTIHVRSLDGRTRADLGQVGSLILDENGQLIVTICGAELIPGESIESWMARMPIAWAPRFDDVDIATACKRAALAYDRWASKSERVCQWDVHAVITRVLDAPDAFCTRVKSGSGVYFVPRFENEAGVEIGAGPGLEAIHKALRSLGVSGLWSLPIYPDGAEAISSAVTDEMVGALDALEKELESATPRKAEARLDVLATLLDRSKLYQELIAFRAEDLEARIEAARRSIAEILSGVVNPTKRAASGGGGGGMDELVTLSDALKAEGLAGKAFRQEFARRARELGWLPEASVESAPESVESAPESSPTSEVESESVSNAESAPASSCEPETTLTEAVIKSVARDAKKTGSAGASGLVVVYAGGVYKWSCNDATGEERSVKGLVSTLTAC